MTAQPSREQWAEVAERLDQIWCPVYLRCDEFLVRACRQQVKYNRLGIVVSVNGVLFDPAWIPLRDRPMSEEARRFWMPHKKAVMPRRMLKRLEEILGKRECRRRGYYDHRIVPDPVWNRPGPFIRHLKKHNASIRLIDELTYETALAAMRARAGRSQQAAQPLEGGDR